MLFRSRKRPEDQSVTVAASPETGGTEDEDDEDDEDDDDDIVVADAGGRQLRTDEDDVDEEPLAPVNYEGIPTWEEAISYLVRSRGPEPRGRGNSGPRGRGGAPQRR